MRKQRRLLVGVFNAGKLLFPLCVVRDNAAAAFVVALCDGADLSLNPGNYVAADYLEDSTYAV